MGQILHGSARTTQAVRRAIQRKQERLYTLLTASTRDENGRQICLCPVAEKSIDVHQNHALFWDYAPSQAASPSAGATAGLRIRPEHLWTYLSTGKPGVIASRRKFL